MRKCTKLTNFEERTERLLASASNFERQNQVALCLIIDEIFESRIQDPQVEAWTETAISAIEMIGRYLIKEPGRPGAPLNIESPEEKKRSLIETYRKVTPTIDKMSPNEKFALIDKLKRLDLRVSEILESIPVQPRQKIGEEKKMRPVYHKISS